MSDEWEVQWLDLPPMPEWFQRLADFIRDNGDLEVFADMLGDPSDDDDPVA